MVRCTVVNGGRCQTKNSSVRPVSSRAPYPCASELFPAAWRPTLCFLQKAIQIKSVPCFPSFDSCLFSYCVDDEVNEGMRCLHRQGGGPLIRADHWSCKFSLLCAKMCLYAVKCSFDTNVDTRTCSDISKSHGWDVFDHRSQVVAAQNEAAFAHLGFKKGLA